MSVFASPDLEVGARVVDRERTEGERSGRLSSNSPTRPRASGTFQRSGRQSRTSTRSIQPTA